MGIVPKSHHTNLIRPDEVLAVEACSSSSSQCSASNRITLLYPSSSQSSPAAPNTAHLRFSTPIFRPLPSGHAFSALAVNTSAVSANAAVASACLFLVNPSAPPRHPPPSSPRPVYPSSCSSRCRTRRQISGSFATCFASVAVDVELPGKRSLSIFESTTV